MKNSDAIQALINKTCDSILDEWTAGAAAQGVDTDEHIAGRLDEMELTEPEMVQAISARYLQRVMGVAV